MTTKPQLNDDLNLLPGLAALGLFVVLAAVFLQTEFGPPQGFPADASIVASIGYAMFNLDFGAVPGESFLVAFMVMAVTLDVAIDAAVYLAQREDEGSFLQSAASSARGAVTGEGVRTDGGADDTEGER
ncbi:NADH-quinone oxidoreductase subunit J [Halogranum amylolyticum]|uniref:NADH-quinone oxidoreductase subunit J n=1 Tax=Halogranum amylolyticum TaxID=660520 RepID=A0A1H8U1G3_9EURY|nr:hypothetical protein [Halogranum amylolyticum]SEO97089.1 NADH-quinone oxidoreductase subunit J [Halogranum amylolyticum]